ncbi:hypothetical protein LTR51_008641 [Lithohypha guttulata]|nr:hypothetical protein LTR51_008641 [Lithohypha guttulata]
MDFGGNSTFDHDDDDGLFTEATEQDFSFAAAPTHVNPQSTQHHGAGNSTAAYPHHTIRHQAPAPAPTLVPASRGSLPPRRVISPPNQRSTGLGITKRPLTQQRAPGTSAVSHSLRKTVQGVSSMQALESRLVAITADA